jgi:hypothetical protein
VQMRMQADCTDSRRAETQHKTAKESTRSAIVLEAETEPPTHGLGCVRDTLAAGRRAQRAATEYVGAGGGEPAGGDEVDARHSPGEEDEGRESAAGCTQRGERTRSLEVEKRTERARGRHTAAPALRHTTLCVSRRQRPLALRPPSAAPSLASSYATAGAHIFSCICYNSSILTTRQSRGPSTRAAVHAVNLRLVVPHPSPFVRLRHARG